MRLPATGLLSVALSWACGGSSEASSTTTSTASAESSAPAPAASRPSADKGMDWNDAEVDWVDLETGLARAKAEDRPLVLVVYTTWCPRCLELSREWKVDGCSLTWMIVFFGSTKNVDFHYGVQVRQGNERLTPFAVKGDGTVKKRRTTVVSGTVDLEGPA